MLKKTKLVESFRIKQVDTFSKVQNSFQPEQRAMKISAKTKQAFSISTKPDSTKINL